MALTDKQIEKIRVGNWINASFLIEVQGNDKEYVKKSLEDMIARLKKEKGADVYEEKYDEIHELDKKLYSYNVEVRFLAKHFGILTHLTLLYSPSVVEIYEPKKITVEIGEAQNLLIDIASVVTSLAHALFIQTGKLRKYEPQKEESS